MRKQNSIIFAILAIVTTISGCGVKNSLYETPESGPVENVEIDPETNKAIKQEQQEQH